MVIGDGILCPCCQHPLAMPTFEMVIDHYRVSPMQARILGAIWRGKGHPVQTERIFDAMYSDDPDGGPEPRRMYVAFKAGLRRLQTLLAGSGVAIEYTRSRGGYRLALAANNSTINRDSPCEVLNG